MDQEYLIRQMEKYADEKGVPIMEKDGINYSLTETGSKLAAELDSVYAEAYRATAQRTVEILAKMDEQEVLNLIAHEASVSIGGTKE